MANKNLAAFFVALSANCCNNNNLEEIPNEQYDTGSSSVLISDEILKKYEYEIENGQNDNLEFVIDHYKFQQSGYGINHSNRLKKLYGISIKSGSDKYLVDILDEFDSTGGECPDISEYYALLKSRGLSYEYSQDGHVKKCVE